MWGTIALVATLIAIIFYRASSRPPSYPPGPLSLPIVGSLLSLLPNPKEAFTQFQQKYGDVFSYKLFKNWGIMICDPTLMRSAFSDPHVQGRIHLLLFSNRNVLIAGKDEPLGILGTNGEVWKNQRRFTLRSLKDLGFGRHSLEPVMQCEVDELGDGLATQINEKVNVGLLFNRSVINVIWAMVMGKRFSHGDVRLDELADKTKKMLQTFDPFNPAFQFRFIKKWFPNLEVFKKSDGYMKDVLVFIEEQLAIYEEEMGDIDDPGCYAGSYLKEMKDCAAQNKETDLSMNHLKANILELFVAGSETTASTLWWAVYLLAKHQAVQHRVQKELEEVVGQGNKPSLEIIERVPYITAVIYEVQRIADLFPFAVPHMATEDTVVAGYKIPKDTRVMFNISHGMKSPKYWKHPDEFYPEHFLTPDGDVFKPDAFMPFGHGKRVCLGESLARIELFLFFTNLFHRFSWKISDDPVTWEKGAIVNRPPNFTVFVSERDNFSSPLRSDNNSG